MTGTTKKPKSPETIKKYGAIYRYNLTGILEKERVEFSTDSLSTFMKGRRVLWKAMIGGEPPNLN